MSISEDAPCAWTLYLVERYMPNERAEALTAGTKECGQALWAVPWTVAVVT